MMLSSRRVRSRALERGVFRRLKMSSHRPEYEEEWGRAIWQQFDVAQVCQSQRLCNTDVSLARLSSPGNDRPVIDHDFCTNINES
jgi:hypothetical protein